MSNTVKVPFGNQDFLLQLSTLQNTSDDLVPNMRRINVTTSRQTIEHVLKPVTIFYLFIKINRKESMCSSRFQV